jgi:hypothetical protein
LPDVRSVGTANLGEIVSKEVKPTKIERIKQLFTFLILTQDAKKFLRGFPPILIKNNPLLIM